MRLGLLLLVVVASVACKSGRDIGGPKPDLMPVKPKAVPGIVGWCRIIDGELEVVVRNKGKVASGETVVRVRFLYGATQPIREATVPALPAGKTTRVRVEIPEPVPPGDYKFRIRVDPHDNVDEQNETNNTAKGRCLT